MFVPPLPEQRAIAGVLSSLDDKIELNRKMNATLEEIARTLFKSWFIDFDPVHAKAAGRAPAGMDAATAALFPDSFEEMQGRKVPKGWKVTNFASIVNLLGGGTPKTDNPNYWNGDIPWFSVVDTPCDSDIFVIDTEKKITQQGLENSSTRLLSVGTSIISARGTVGKCALVGVPMAMNQSCYGVQPKDGFGSFFVFFLLRSTVNVLLKKTHGAVFDTITRETFKAVSVIVPGDAITMQFDMKLKPYFKQILLNIMQSRTITSVRDTLLPKLMSGEIRVRDAERFVEEQL